MGDLTIIGPDVHVRSVLFQLLKECNYTCAHCSQDAAHLSLQSMQPVPLKIVLERLGALHRAGAQRIRFTGGEPLLHPQLDEICVHSVRLGLEVSIVTNGALLSSFCLALADAGVASIWISFYGPNSNQYAKIAGRKPPITSIVKAVEKLVVRQVVVGLYCTIRLDELTNDFELLDEVVRAGASRVKFVQFMEQGRRNSVPQQVGKDACINGLAAIRRFVQKYPNVRVQTSVRNGQGSLFRSEGWHLPSRLNCSAGEPDSWALTFSGKSKPCCLMLVDRDMNPGYINTSLEERGSQSMVFPRLSDVSVFGSNESCLALPDYLSQDPTEFICPLVYAERAVTRGAR